MGEVRKVRIDGQDAGYAEAIPPGARDQEPLIRLIAVIMDSVFRIPGTNIRFGMDPLVGLLPGVGDGLGALVSVSIIALSARYGLPRIVLMRMALNVVLNTLIGAIPGVGDAFSLWFKSNALNHALFLRHAGRRRVSTAGDWVFVGLLIGAVLLVVGLVLAGVFLAMRAVWGMLFG